MRNGVTNLSLGLLLFCCGCMGISLSTHRNRLATLEAKVQVMQLDLSMATFEARQATKALASEKAHAETE